MYIYIYIYNTHKTFHAVTACVHTRTYACACVPARVRACVCVFNQTVPYTQIQIYIYVYAR